MCPLLAPCHKEKVSERRMKNILNLDACQKVRCFILFIEVAFNVSLPLMSLTAEYDCSRHCPSFQKEMKMSHKCAVFLEL